MRSLRFFALFCALAVMSTAHAGSGDMEVSTWDPGCEYLLSTNHFELAPGESVQITLDWTSCAESQLGRALFYGYRTTKNSSKPLNSRDKIQLRVVDTASGEEWVSNSGSILLDVDHPTSCIFYAKNTNRSKTIKVRLMANSGM